MFHRITSYLYPLLPLPSHITSQTRELHGDGDDGITAVMGLDFMTRDHGNSGDGDSSHGSTAVAVTELTVDA